MRTETDRALRIVLVATGIAFTVGIVVLMRVWPSGWSWTPGQPEYEQMILGVYATLGIFLLLAARNPSQHRSLILFTGWSSIVHAAIMAIQALREVSERGHLVGDVPALMVIGVALLALAPAREARVGERGNADGTSPTAALGAVDSESVGAGAPR
ncbi:MAG TPA: DUF6632 domain-containing protein [Longimicrobiales bacterium]|nr:DUF6632 domain-containing protein [Longimicrobiales bacterium]